MLCNPLLWIQSVIGYIIFSKIGKIMKMLFNFENCVGEGQRCPLLD
jgi:hypothetical protein